MTHIEILIFVGIILIAWLVVGAIYITPKMKAYTERGQRLAWYEIVTCLPWWVLVNLSKPVER